MKQPSPAFDDLGVRLLAHEADGRTDSTDLAAGAEAVLLKLHARLTILFGQEGFQSVLARALRLAKTRHPLLAAVEAEPPGSPAGGVQLKGLRESVAGGDPAAVTAALATITGSFIWLLATFIGQDMVWRELRRIWPALSFPEAGPGAEEAKQ